MSRSRNTDPYYVRAYSAESYERHDHTAGDCDLPDSYAEYRRLREAAPSRYRVTRCSRYVPARVLSSSISHKWGLRLWNGRQRTQLRRAMSDLRGARIDGAPDGDSRDHFDDLIDGAEPRVPDTRGRHGVEWWLD
ncbi:MAG: hypothetical protein WKF57_06305 [Nakamurella sp.]